MTEVRMGPYRNEAKAKLIARKFTEQGLVKIERIYEPYQKKGQQTTFYVIREVPV